MNMTMFFQVHSITARSVPREFRESLKLGRSEVTDTIFKLPEAKQNDGEPGTVRNKSNIMVGIYSFAVTLRSLL